MRLLTILMVPNFLTKTTRLRRHGKCTVPHHRVGLLRLALAVALAGGIAHAQPGCPPVNFQGAASASLKPSASTHMLLLQQSDGSYTAFEMTDASPYRIVRTTRNFQKQFAGCPGLPVAGKLRNLQPPEVFTRLSSGGYLWVRRSDVNGSPGGRAALYATAFDSALNLISEAQYPVQVVEALAVVDVNGDGIPDILAASDYFSGSRLEVLIGNGGSSFQPAVAYGISSSLEVYSISVADLNGDHKPDAVIATSFGDTAKISVFLGNGDGTFQAERTAFSGSYVRAVAIADLNGDGKPDLAFTIQGDNHYLLEPAAEVALGAGDGTFGVPTRYPIAWSDSLAIADMNGDGFPDIVTSGFSILFGDGHGGFPKRADYWQEVTGGIILADFNGDGRPDILVGTGTAGAITGPSLAVLFAGANGTFGGPPISLVSGLTPSTANIHSQVAADFNGDGFADVVVQSVDELNVLTGVGDGTFRRTFHYAPGIGSSLTQVATADFNHDGKLDMVVTVSHFGFGIFAGSAPDASTEVFLGNGDGTFQAPLPVRSACCVTAIAVADFNGDGHPDVAVLLHNTGPGAVSDQMLTYLGTGAGTFAAPLASAAGVYPSALAVGDFNRDGKLDVVVADQGDITNATTPGSGFRILFGKGDGTFSAPVSIFVGTDKPGPIGLVAADWNRDGLPDLAVTLNGGPLVVLPGRGDGTFQAPTMYWVTGFNQLAVADLNGDGIPDLIGAGPRWRLGNGDGAFGPEETFAGSTYPLMNSVIAADFNHDGRIDLAGEIYPAGVAVLLNISQPAPLTVVSAASFAAGPLAPDSLATAFGAGLAPNTAVTVAGTSATILYASSGQVNFLVPSSVPTGSATVTVAGSKGSVSTPVTIAAVAPALFTLNAAALAAAYVVRVRQGNQTVEPISDPIDLGPPGDQVYLSLFGTGLRGAPPGQVSVGIQGIDAPVIYAGPQSQFSGLDQVNVQLPRELIGTGDVSVVLTAAGIAALTVHISVK
jgi:uncharacterized protein (TIGR03437 family)